MIRFINPFQKTHKSLCHVVTRCEYNSPAFVTPLVAHFVGTEEVKHGHTEERFIKVNCILPQAKYFTKKSSSSSHVPEQHDVGPCPWCIINWCRSMFMVWIVFMVVPCGVYKYFRCYVNGLRQRECACEMEILILKTQHVIYYTFNVLEISENIKCYNIF